MNQITAICFLITIFFVVDRIDSLGYVKKQSPRTDLLFLGGKKIFEIDKRLLCFTWVGLFSGTMGIYNLGKFFPISDRGRGIVKWFTFEDLKISLLYYIILGFTIFLSIRSKRITGIESNKTSLFDLAYLFLVYKCITYIHLFLFFRYIPFVELLIKTVVYYYLTHEIIFAYFLLWIVNIFGREHCYKNQRVYIKQKGLFLKMYLQDKDMIFLLNNKCSKRYEDYIDKIIIMDEIWIKSFFLCNRKLITVMW